MIKRIIAACLIFLLLFMHTTGMAAETVAEVLSSGIGSITFEYGANIHVNAVVEIPTNVANVSNDKIGTYTVSVMENACDSLQPNCFSDLKVVQIAYDATFQKEFEWDMAPIRYVYENGNSLTIASYETFIWAGKDAEKYQQLFGYHADWFKDMSRNELSFMTKEEARRLATDYLKNVNIVNPQPYDVYSAGISEIEAVTRKMTEGGHGKAISVFEEPTIENEAYYIVLKAAFDGIPSINTPDSYICINQNGVVAAFVSHITGAPVNVTWHSVMLSAPEALDVFIDQYAEVLQNVYVNQITLGYVEDYSRTDYTKFQTCYVPCWKISYDMEAFMSPELNKESEIVFPKTMIINALDGSIY